MKTYPHENLYTNGHNRLNHNSQKVEEIQHVLIGKVLTLAVHLPFTQGGKVFLGHLFIHPRHPSYLPFNKMTLNVHNCWIVDCPQIMCLYRVEGAGKFTLSFLVFILEDPFLYPSSSQHSISFHFPLQPSCPSVFFSLFPSVLISSLYELTNWF